MEPCQTKFQPAWLCTSVVFKLKLLFGVRIEPAEEVRMFVGYPRLVLVGGITKRQPVYGNLVLLHGNAGKEIE